MNGRHALLALATLLATSAVVFGLGPFATLLSMSPDGTVLDTAPRQPAATAAWLAELGSPGRTWYAAFLAWDTVFLLVHGATLFVLLRVALVRLTPRLLPIAWLPVAAAALDAAENLLAARLLAAFPTQTPGEAHALATVTSCKLTLVPACFAMVGAAWLAVALRGPCRGWTLRIRARSCPRPGSGRYEPTVPLR